MLSLVLAGDHSSKDFEWSGQCDYRGSSPQQREKSFSFSRFLQSILLPPSISFHLTHVFPLKIATDLHKR